MADLTDAALDEMLALAEKATQGEWCVVDGKNASYIRLPSVCSHRKYIIAQCDRCIDEAYGPTAETSKANAAFIAALDPPTVRALISELKRLRAEGWRPIDDDRNSEARSGKRVLVTGGALGPNVDVATYSDVAGVWRLSTLTLDDRDDEPDGYSRPTHWRPRPAPPSQDGEAT